MKLLACVFSGGPGTAVFGRKDYQQALGDPPHGGAVRAAHRHRDRRHLPRLRSGYLSAEDPNVEARLQAYQDYNKDKDRLEKELKNLKAELVKL